MSELKDCPFCGGIAELYEGEAGFSVECAEFSCRAGTLDSDLRKDKAIEIWNKREQQDNWISVGDRLPDERCLAYTPYQSDDMAYRIIPAGLFRKAASNATHWQPLPTPPKELK